MRYNNFCQKEVNMVYDEMDKTFHHEKGKGMNLLQYDDDYYYFICGMKFEKEDTFNREQQKRLKENTSLYEFEEIFHPELKQVFSKGLFFQERKLSLLTMVSPYNEEEKDRNLLKGLQKDRTEDPFYLQFLAKIPKAYFDYDRDPKPIWRRVRNKDSEGKKTYALDPSFIVGAYYKENHAFVLNPYYLRTYHADGLLFNDPTDEVDGKEAVMSEEFLEQDRFRLQFKSYTGLRLYDILNATFDLVDMTEDTPKTYQKRSKI